MVFPNEIGRRVEGIVFYKGRYLPIVTHAGLPRIKFHELRHTFGTFLLLLGIDPKIVSDMLGHR